MNVVALPDPPTARLRDWRRLQDIPAVRQLLLLGIVTVAIAGGLWLFFWTQRPDYVPVHAAFDAKATAEASEVLRSRQIPFRLDPASGALAVPTDRLGDARLALAAAGLAAEQGQGFEMMTGDQGFGTSQFIESARYQYALETELARTIAELRPVREARVHLALPKPSAFTRQKDVASASVVLKLHTGSTLEQDQVAAIVHLVASSIPNLAPERVTVVDQFGRMLSNPDPDSEAAIGARQFEQQRRQETVYVQRIHELLEPMTGNGRISAQVSVDMDFDQTEEAREIYGPQPAAVRSEQVSEAGTVATVPAQGVPGSASNAPDAADAPLATNAPPPGIAAAAPGPASAAPSATPASRTAVRNYEVDRTLTHKRQAPGRIRRVTAAVLVDHIPGGPPGKDGKPTLRPLTAAELERLQTLVQQAIGYDAQRGDAVSVVNVPFARDAAPVEESTPPLWQHPRARDLLRTLLGGLAVLLLILFVLRPAFRQLLAPRASAPVLLPAADEAVVPQTQTMGAPAAATGAPPQAMSFEDKLQLARTAVNTDAKRVAAVVRDWVEQDG